LRLILTELRVVAEIIDNELALFALQADWQSLSGALPDSIDFFSSWDYVSSFVRFHQRGHWYIATFRDATTRQLVGVFPLRVFQLKGSDGVTYQACQPLGPGVVPYIEMPVRSGYLRLVLQQLLNAVLKQQLKVDVAFFWPLHESSALYRSLLEDFGVQGIFKIHRYPRSLSTIETWGIDCESYYKNLPSGVFRDARYRERRLGKLGNVQITQEQGPEQVRATVALLCQWNINRYAEKHAYVQHPQWAEFTTHLAADMAQRGLAEVLSLRLDGVPIAATLSFVYKRRRCFYLYDGEPAYRQYSSSKIVLSHLIERSFEAQQIFCFGSGDYAYKRDWAQSVGEIKACCLFLNPLAQTALGEQLDSKNIVNGLGALL
jgi:hypothetical protein